MCNNQFYTYNILCYATFTSIFVGAIRYFILQKQQLNLNLSLCYFREYKNQICMIHKFKSRLIYLFSCKNNCLLVQYIFEYKNCYKNLGSCDINILNSKRLNLSTVNLTADKSVHRN